MATKDKLVNLEDLKSVYDHGMDLLDEKANQVGEYVDLIAGTADNLLSSSYQTDSTPYILRRTPYGARERGSIVGGSIVWNQLENLTSGVSNGITYTKNDDGSITMSGTSTAISSKVLVQSSDLPPVGHKVLLLRDNEGTYPTVQTNGENPNISYIHNMVASDYIRLRFVADYTASLTIHVNVIDLTKMFGPTIADYLYSIDSATAGAGVALAKSLAGITADYYPYDAGSIKSVTGLTAHKMVGFNQWDEEWEVGGLTNTGAPVSGSNRIRSKNYCQILPNTTYFATCGKTDGGNQNMYYIAVHFYDSDKEFISSAWANNKTFTTPSNAAYFKITTNSSTVVYGDTYNHDICINISDPAKNGTYEPYTAHAYPLDSSLTLRGLPKLDGDNLYYDGDIYPPSGEVERKYYLIDMGVLNWKKSSSGNNYYANLGDGGGLYPKYAIGNAVGMMCARYIVAGARSASPFYGGDKEMTYYYRATAQNPECEIYVHDESYTDVASFKSAMSGVYLVYELATPTTEQAEPYTALQICDPNGTEEWVGASMPVGHDTKYYADLKGKIEGIPDAPSADGTYTLKVTVSNGVATYSWE